MLFGLPSLGNVSLTMVTQDLNFKVLHRFLKYFTMGKAWIYDQCWVSFFPSYCLTSKCNDFSSYTSATVRNIAVRFPRHPCVWSTIIARFGGHEHIILWISDKGKNTPDSSSTRLITSSAVHSLASVSYSSLIASARPFRLVSSVGPSIIFCQTTCPEQY